MEDRELLELAAKAADMGSVLYVPMSRDSGDFMVEEFDGGPLKPWNPLTNDCDALRLAVKLSLMVDIYNSVKVGRDLQFESRITDAWYDRQDLKHDGKAVSEPHAECPFAATRRAIVRAAAEIGRAKS
jgi:hypothetical protein